MVQDRPSFLPFRGTMVILIQNILSKYRPKCLHTFHNNMPPEMCTRPCSVGLYRVDNTCPTIRQCCYPSLLYKELKWTFTLCERQAAQVVFSDGLDYSQASKNKLVQQYFQIEKGHCFTTSDLSPSTVLGALIKTSRCPQERSPLCPLSKKR